jgi:hypothetical protein
MNILQWSSFVLLHYVGFSLGYTEPSMNTLIPSPQVLPHSNFFPPQLTDLISTLSTLQRKPSCYRTAAASVIHHCKSLSTDIPDPDRIQFAIKLTICELDLIHQTPSTCLIESRWRECVKTLATKDHWWTTFCGNLHEVISVCWIGRQEVEKGSQLLP